MDISIRPARAEDEAAIAALQTRSWQNAYRGHLTDAYLDHEAAGDLAAQWRGRFADPDPRSHILVAEGSAGVSGFIAIWPDTDDPALAYIDNLHVEPGQRGGGIGRKLMTTAARYLADDGYRSAYLFVFAANTRAVAFYERLDGAIDAREMKTVANTSAPTFRMSWHDLAALAAAA